MHSDTVDKSVSPKRRILTRTVSEEESLRHIIEAEESPKRVSRRDSRYGSLRRGDTIGSQQSEDEPAENTSMLELQQSYEVCVAELKTVELRQEVLLFQIECLQDALEGAEEMLSETKREAHQFSMELEREREQKRKLEDTVDLLMQELNQLKEETVSVTTENIIQDQNEAAGMTDNPTTEVDGYVSTEPPVKSADTVSQSTSSSLANFVSATYLIFKNRKIVTNLSKPADLDGTSVDQGDGSTQATPEESIQKIYFTEDIEESSGYEDAPSDFSPGSSTPDGTSDAVLQEIGGTELKNCDEARNINNPDACILS